jgi:iron(III) transport system ATP-binding protein
LVIGIVGTLQSQAVNKLQRGSMAAIQIEHLVKRFGPQTVLQDLSLQIPDGAFYTLLGPSGCGKTTLLRCIAGFYRPDAGSLLFDQDDVTQVPAHRRNIGMVFQDYALFPDKTAFENVAYGLRARGVAKAELRTRANQALDAVGLLELASRYPAQLSGGQRQRVALARALVIRPRVLLMDEPLSNLDAKMRLQMRDVILDLVREAGITTVFVTHDQEEALAMSDRIAIMDHGAIAQVGSPEDLYATPVNAYVADFIGAANVVRVALEGGDEMVMRYRLGGQLLEGRRGEDGNDANARGESALLVVRPEELALHAEVDPQPNSVGAKILRRQFLGAKTLYRVRLANGTELRAEHASGAFHAGDVVRVQIPATCRVIAR